MAEDQKSGSNINQNPSSGTTGLNLDSSINQVKPGSLTYALNAAVENFDGNIVNYQNELGNDLCVTFPKSYLLIGTHFINEKNKHIFFLHNPVNGDSEIGYMENNDCIYHTLVNAPCLNFNLNNPIHKVVHKITNCTIEIYWTDGFNVRRYLDLNNIPYLIQPNANLCNPAYTNQLDCNQIKIQPNFSIPQLTISKIRNGGELISGTYQFAIQYCDAVGNGYTSYYSVTNPTPIMDEQQTTVNFNTSVNKSIVVDISDIDITGQYQYYNLAVIKTINNATAVDLVGTYFIEQSTNQVTYTGSDQSPIKLSIQDIFEKFPYYEIAQDITAVQDILVWDNLTSINRINYQSIANQITVGWETYRIPASENYADELNATNLRGYLRDEVYAFEIVFLLKNGKQTDGFHIPGRVQNWNEWSQPNIPITSADFIGDPETGTNYSPYWKIYNTASVTGFVPGYSVDANYKGPWQYGEMAFWQSEEKYPCNVDVWGDLADQYIRHHKFPDVLISPINESKIFASSTSMVMGNDAVFPIGLRIDPIQISYLVYNSNLTADEKSEIAGFKIVRGNRGTHKSIVAKGILRNVNSYEREGQYYYYPNYPYNEVVGNDPFVNSVNNAWTEICEPWNIDIFQFNLPNTGTPTYVEIEYTNCNNNKTDTIKYTTLGRQILCSITRPIPQGTGSFNRMTTNRAGRETPTPGTILNIGPSNYDVWEVGVGKTSLGTGKAGYEVQWTDPVAGLQHEWVPGGIFGGGTYQLNTLVDGRPVNISTGSAANNEEFGRIEQVRSTACKTETPQPDISSKPDLAYRQVFNSPETSFGQPFLGNVLKLENVMFGKGLGHFVEVRGNAKYKLLTYEAQYDALSSSQAIASYGAQFNAGAMFTVYQSYLTIYINGITRRNYAYSYNSIADYNYNVGVGNNITVGTVQGIKQRMLDIARYLIPGVESVGDTINVPGVGVRNAPINNYRRESSVYLKTMDVGVDGVTPVAPLPLPSNSPSMIIGGKSIVTEKSRLTIGSSNACASPAKEQAISVVSYYASLKNIIPNQWGQIYTYTTVDTGYQSVINPTKSGHDVVFGGDTFVSRFTFKTKLPFFIDNRVNAPDDSDIFYDEIGNIAYPIYWHSSRSILKDYGYAPDGALSNVISYKAHHFDCPNKQDPGPNRTYYNGYFYLFAYGIPNFYCESSYNTDLRQAFNNREGDFWPHISSSIPDDWVQENYVSIAFDNTYNYNITYSKQNKENVFTHLPADWKKDFCFTYYPFRTIYSDSQNIDADNRINSWLTYRSTSYFDFPQNYGNLISLDGIQNKAILARFENKSLLYNTLLTIDTSNPQAAYMGNPSLFRSSPPIDFAETDLGYVGSQNKFLLKIPQGQITVDAKRGQIFLLTSEGAKDLTSFSSGMNNFFTNHLQFEILRYFPNKNITVNGKTVTVPGVDIDNSFNGIGLHGVYDSRYERIIITKLDYIPIDKNVKYDYVTKEFYVDEPIVGSAPIRIVVSLLDPEYFCNKSWTVSYNFNTQSWVSFHSYLPNFYMGENNFFYSGINGCCDDFDFVAGEIVPDPPTTTTTTTPNTRRPTTSTTTTISSYNCVLEGDIVFTDCVLDGNGIITVGPLPPPCVRPENLSQDNFAIGYRLTALNVVIDSTGSDVEACNAMTYLNTVPPDTTVNTIIGSYSSIGLGSIIYAGPNYETDCSVIPDGWYFTDQSSSNELTYEVVDGIIMQIVECCVITTSTTTTAPVVLECCGVLLSSIDNIYYLNKLTDSVNLINVPGYVSSLGIAMTANYLWSIDTTIEQWDIALSPFSATYNTSIALPMGYTPGLGIFAKDEYTLISTDTSASPNNVVELDITGVTAVSTIMFSLQANRISVTNLLYTVDGKLIVANQDVMTSDYYITQYDYATNVIEFDLNIGTIAPASLFGCNCDIYVTDADSNLYTLVNISGYELLSLSANLGITSIGSAAQVGSCVHSTITEDIFTTTTTTTI